MTKKYDVIVVGAGLGGLSVANVLAQKGLGVLLLERHNIPGGYATSFVRGRYEFDTALHELSGIGPPERRGDLYTFLEGLGITEEVEFIQVKEMYRSIFPDLDIVLPIGHEAYEEALCQTFPDDAKGIRTFLAQVLKMHNEIQYFEKHGGPGNLLTAPFRFSKTLRYLPARWGTVLNRHVKDPRARAVISQYWGYFGMAPSEVSYLYFANALSIYMKLGAAYVKGRSQALSNAFVSALERFGGEIKLSCGVEKITTTNGRATGVITDDGEEIAADWVISNGDPITTCRNLIGDDKVPSKFFRSLRSRTLSPSSLNVFMGINRTPEQLGIEHHENFINSSYDFEDHHDRMSVVDVPGTTLCACYTAIDPSLSPPGTTVLSLTTLFYGEPWYHLSPEEYVETKNRIADGMIKAAEQIAPDIRKYAEVVEVGTPITNMRYTGALSGSIYGFSNSAFDHTVLRMGHKGPLDGLYFVGAWTQPGGGFHPCIMSGQMAAEQILKKARIA